MEFDGADGVARLAIRAQDLPSIVCRLLDIRMDRLQDVEEESPATPTAAELEALMGESETQARAGLGETLSSVLARTRAAAEQVRDDRDARQRQAEDAA